MGPARLPPNWFHRRGDLPSLFLFEKKSLAFSLSLRKNSNSVPCQSLEPERVVMFSTPPPARPYSAEEALAVDLNSWIASTLTVLMSVPPPPADWKLAAPFTSPN